MGALFRAILNGGIVPFLEGILEFAVKFFFFKYWWFAVLVVILILWLW